MASVLTFAFENERTAFFFKKWMLEEGKSLYRKSSGALPYSRRNPSIGRIGIRTIVPYDPIRRREQHLKFIAKDPIGYKIKVRNGLLMRNYGITTEQWNELFLEQGEKCACCGTNDPGSKKGWHTDHDHQSGDVRGILCARCNIVLGMMGDTVEKVAETAGMFLDYLAKVQEKTFDEFMDESAGDSDE